ncbi:MAG TPA: sigma 54-interacting transcriptional regulator, partial [Thermoanaerobaculia bacterium]|nr:sigma 54-interacting transcriptional regulator [Thermoanaerobaculia bacterium]
ILGDDAASLLARARVVLDAHLQDESERLLEEARRASPLSKEEEAELHLMRAEIAWRRQEFPRALGGLRRAMRALAACEGDGSLESFATAGVLASDLGRTDEAVALFRRVRERARDGATRADASLDIAVALLHAGRAAEAERELEAALAGYEERGQHERYLSALGNRVELAILRGDFAAAREDLARVLVHDSAPGHDHQFLFSVSTRQRLALLDGDLDAAAAAFREAEARPAFARHAARREALALEAARLLAAREPGAARRRLADAASIPDNRLQTAPLLARLEASVALDLGETPDLSRLPDGEAALLRAETRMARNEPPDEAALAELRRRARTAAGSGDVAARVLEWSGRFPELFASERAEEVLGVARAAAARARLERAAERLASLGSRRAPEPAAPAGAPPPELVAEDDSTRAVLEVVRKVARSRITVLVLGETGTGKELVARELHRASGRSPFVAVNVAALAPSLVESELFGHARGAFTGADRPREGLLEAASKGTLFLDEIGDLPLPLQAKLLRALQERSITRVGEVRPRAVDLRVVAATHRDLARMVAAGTFRADLYHRLSGVVVSLAPLRERPRDLAAVLERCLDGRTLTAEARRLLLAHRWPGNIRELVSAVESARVLAAPSRRVELAHLPPALREPEAAGGNGSYRERVDGERRRAILEALAVSAGNRTRAARALELSRQSLLYEMKKLGIR